MSDFELFKYVKSLTSGDRRRDYDHPLPNHLRISIIWSVQTGITLNPIQVAFMIGSGLKAARQVKTSKFDNVVDTAGYMDCVSEMCILYNKIYGKPTTNDLTDTMKEIESLGIGEQWDLLHKSNDYLNKEV